MSHESQKAHDGRSMRERMLAGDLYIADDPQLARDSRRRWKSSSCDPAVVTRLERHSASRCDLGCLAQMPPQTAMTADRLDSPRDGVHAPRPGPAEARPGRP
jgi:hypothetical protein